MSLTDWISVGATVVLSIFAIILSSIQSKKTDANLKKINSASDLIIKQSNDSLNNLKDIKLEITSLYKDAYKGLLELSNKIIDNPKSTNLRNASSKEIIEEIIYFLNDQDIKLLTTIEYLERENIKIVANYEYDDLLGKNVIKNYGYYHEFFYFVDLLSSIDIFVNDLLENRLVEIKNGYDSYNLPKQFVCISEIGKQVFDELNLQDKNPLAKIIMNYQRKNESVYQSLNSKEIAFLFALDPRDRIVRGTDLEDAPLTLSSNYLRLLYFEETPTNHDGKLEISNNNVNILINNLVSKELIQWIKYTQIPKEYLDYTLKGFILMQYLEEIKQNPYMHFNLKPIKID